MSDALIPYAYARRHEIMVASDVMPIVLLHTRNTPAAIIHEVKRALAIPEANTNCIDETAFQHQLQQHYTRASHRFSDVIPVQPLGDIATMIAKLPTLDVLDSTDQSPVVQLLNAIINEAVRLSASDIHLETYANQLQVRLRIDGVLQALLSLEATVASYLISRIKVLAQLDIAEKRLPQDGRLSITRGRETVDVRVATIPIQHGERVVLRILEQNQQRLSLSDLGLNAVAKRQVMHMVHAPHGIVLVTGPTGAGKTTTLYAALNQINHVQRNILTIEDPIEYELPGIGQTQVNSKLQLNFATGLRALLRQDPDVIMLGEIRDAETAQIAIQASLTGHLVLSTLHTNTALGAITRLKDIGIAPFLIAASVKGLIAQRLVRCLCQQCRQAYKPDAKTRTLLALPDSIEQLYREQGCHACGDTGFKGRIGIYDVIAMTEALRQSIIDDQPLPAEQDGMGLSQDAAAKVIAGITSVTEVMRVMAHVDWECDDVAV